MSSGGLYGGQIRDFLRSQCAGGDLRIISAEGEVISLHSFFLLGNLPHLSLLLERCPQCRDLSTEDVMIIAPGNPDSRFLFKYEVSGLYCRATLQDALESICG